MKLEKLLDKKVGKDHEDLHAKVPKGTKEAIEKKYGRGSITKITKQGIYEMLRM